MTRVTLGWKIFIAIQFVGIVALLLCRVFMHSPAAPELWAVGFFSLLPGDAWPAARVEHLLWMTGLSQTAIGIIALTAGIAANALCWWMLLLVVRFVIRLINRPNQTLQPDAGRSDV